MAVKNTGLPTRPKPAQQKATEMWSELCQPCKLIKVEECLPHTAFGCTKEPPRSTCRLGEAPTNPLSLSLLLLSSIIYVLHLLFYAQLHSSYKSYHLQKSHLLKFGSATGICDTSTSWSTKQIVWLTGTGEKAHHALNAVSKIVKRRLNAAQHRFTRTSSKTQVK